MKNKKVIIIILALILVVGILAMISTMVICHANSFEGRMEKLKQEYLSNKEFNVEEECSVFISISDTKNTAKIIHSTKEENFEAAYEKALEKTKEYIEENNYDAEWIKIDVTKNIQKITIDQLYTKVAEANSYSGFQYGLSTDSDLGIALLSEEITYNHIIDVKDDVVSSFAFQEYTNSNAELEDGKNFYIFETISYFIDENNKVYEINKEEMMEGARKLENITKDDVKGIIESAKEDLIKQIDENGKYVYDRRILTDREVEGYNSLRHMGTTWALLGACEVTSKEDLAKIKLTIDYGIENWAMYEDDQTAYIKDDETIKIGANALTILALLKYDEVAGTNEYAELAEKLSNGIMKLQGKDGSVYHVLDLNFEKYRQFATTYYDGESAFALIEMYEKTKDEKYYEAAKNLIDYCIAHDYVEEKDQWLAYTMNRFIKYNQDEKYINFVLASITKNQYKTCDPEQLSMVDMEFLMANYETYKYIKQNNLSASGLENFDEEQFLNTIEKRVRIGLSGFSFPEIEMYFPTLEKYRGTFFEKDVDEYRIRIDNVQHNLSGYILYYNNLLS